MAATLVQTKTGSSASNSTAIGLALASNVGVGDTIIVAFQQDSSTDLVSSVTSTGMSFSKITAASGTNSDGFAYLSVWYAFNTPSATTPTISINKTSAVSGEAVLFHYSGLTTADPLDKTASATGSSTAPASGNTATLSQASEVVVGVVGSDFGGATYTVGSGYGHLIQITANGFSEMAMEDKQVAATTAVAAAFTLSSSSSWRCSALTFKIAAAGGSTITNRKTFSSLGTRVGSRQTRIT